ncbi:o-succinylbenzoate synthase [Sediminibacillus dalangtanensis]|uniref:o-succinylbenzoate synthase n=1 Tax=Sediminibacillus dalangtanensis TaxID=2729421 RepID=A0ABX7W0F1_9BACI|nr:o-succinylbenzoate synthase [Sediminibacillus dalangtanensis]QTN01616.1 o-succinylbenzoate synthase [Sediminibacillus dalangtanensis]
MDLKNPFQTSFGTFSTKDFFIVEAVDGNGNSGFGESVAFPVPWYTEETVATTEHVIKDFLLPLLFKKSIRHPDEISSRFSVIRRNNMAKAAVEGAVWDLYAKRQGLSLAAALGGERHWVESGVSIGIQPSVSKLLAVMEHHLEEGYKRIKLKIKPGMDVAVLREVRRHFPDVQLMADANSAYTLQDVDILKRLDEFGLTMIEQPLGHDDIYEHSILQSKLETPICLDESISSLTDARAAVKLGSCRVINLKIGRVGGLSETKKIHDFCREKNIPVWCGGMLEAGVGRAHNIAIASLPQFLYPGDISASERYWRKDIITPPVILQNGEITIKDIPGIGYDIDWQALESNRIERQVHLRQ